MTIIGTISIPYTTQKSFWKPTLAPAACLNINGVVAKLTAAWDISQMV